MKKQVMVYSKLDCTECGTSLNVPRKRSKRREQGHIKDMWCPMCKKETKFIENKKDKSYEFWENFQNQY